MSSTCLEVLVRLRCARLRRGVHAMLNDRQRVAELVLSLGVEPAVLVGMRLVVAAHAGRAIAKGSSRLVEAVYGLAACAELQSAHPGLTRFG